MIFLKTIIHLAITPIMFIVIGGAKVVKHQRTKDNNALDLDKIILNN